MNSIIQSIPLVGRSVVSYCASAGENNWELAFHNERLVSLGLHHDELFSFQLSNVPGAEPFLQTGSTSARAFFRSLARRLYTTLCFCKWPRVCS